MIQISPRVGSVELRNLFKSFDVSVDTSIDIPFGDFTFIGNGPDGLCKVAVERKQLGDLLDSIRSRRLSGHQLGGLCQEFEYVIIVIEGQWKCGEHGELMTLRYGKWVPANNGNQSVLYRSVQNYTLSLRTHAGTFAGNPLITERTLEPFETVAAIVAWWHWFNDKQWSQHRSHEAVYNKDYTAAPQRRQFIRREVSQCERYMAVSDGVDQGAKFLADRFGSMFDLCHASVEEIAETPVEQWLKAGGTRIVKLGLKRAEKIWASLRKRD